MARRPWSWSGPPSWRSRRPASRRWAWSGSSGRGRSASAAPVAAGIAIGPMAGWVLGPNRCWSLALPSQGGLPLVVDSGLSAAEAGGHSDTAGAAGRRGSAAPKSATAGRDGPPSASPLLEGFWLGTEVLVPEGGWLVAAVSIPALESFATFDERLAAVATGCRPPPAGSCRRPGRPVAGRCRQKGVAVEPSAWKSLAQWARRLSVDTPRSPGRLIRWAAPRPLARRLDPRPPH